MATPRPWLLIVLLACSPALGDELVIVGEHSSRGRDARGTFQGTVVIDDGARFVDRRAYADGRELTLRGEVRIAGRALELRSAQGTRRFERQDTDRQVRWRWSDGEAEQLLAQRKRKESRLGVVRRLLQRPGGIARWVLRDNLGTIDADPQRLILRSRQPSPADLVRYQEEYGLKTVISLNGDQDDEVWYVPKPQAGKVEAPRQVNLRDFLRERGLRHEAFSLSASRAPTDQELTRIFRLLRDDALKPILVHCRGGSDRTGVVGALYALEYQGATKAEAKATMRKHLWAADGGTEVQGAVVDLYRPGHLRRLLGEPLGAWY